MPCMRKPNAMTMIPRDMIQLHTILVLRLKAPNFEKPLFGLTLHTPPKTHTTDMTLQHNRNLCDHYSTCLAPCSAAAETVLVEGLPSLKLGVSQNNSYRIGNIDPPYNAKP